MCVCVCVTLMLTDSGSDFEVSVACGMNILPFLEYTCPYAHRHEKCISLSTSKLPVPGSLLVVV